MNLQKVIDKFIAVRDERDRLNKEHKTKMARYTTALSKLEEALLTHFNQTGANSASTDSGVAYKNIKTSVTVDDRDAFLAFVRDNDAWAFLDSRANKTAVNEYLEEHEALPPGLSISRVASVGVQRPRKS